MKDGAWNKKNDKNRVLVLIGHILCMQLISLTLTVLQACSLEVSGVMAAAGHSYFMQLKVKGLLDTLCRPPSQQLSRRYNCAIHPRL